MALTWCQTMIACFVNDERFIMESVWQDASSLLSRLRRTMKHHLPVQASDNSEMMTRPQTSIHGLVNVAQCIGPAKGFANQSSRLLASKPRSRRCQAHYPRYEAWLTGWHSSGSARSVQNRAKQRPRLRTWQVRYVKRADARDVNRPLRGDLGRGNRNGEGSMPLTTVDGLLGWCKERANLSLSLSQD